jgi:hypothetical protein
MWIAAKVEKNKDPKGSSQQYRLYALPGQSIPNDRAIQYKAIGREVNLYYILDVDWSGGTNKVSYPYILRKHTQVPIQVSRQKAQAFVRKMRREEQDLEAL